MATGSDLTQLVEDKMQTELFNSDCGKVTKNLGMELINT